MKYGKWTAWAAFQFLFLPLFTSPVWAGGITFVQEAGATGATASSQSLAFPRNNTPGNLLVVTALWTSKTITVSVTDSLGNTYIPAPNMPYRSPLVDYNPSEEIWYVKNCAGGPNTVTFAFSGAVYADIAIHEYSGLDPNAPVDVAANASGESAAVDSGPATTTSSSELLFAVNNNSDGGCNSTPGPGYRVRFCADGAATEDQIVSTAGTYDGTFTLSAVEYWDCLFVTFRGSTVAPPPGPVLAVSPGSLSFSATAGGANPKPQTVTVSNKGGGTLNWAASANQAWISPNPASGTAPSTVSVSVAIGSLNPGTYSGMATFTSTGAQGSPAFVSVNLTVSAAPPPTPRQPYIYCVTPNQGPVGTSVTITGDGFQGGDVVTIGGVTASAQIISSSQITAVAPNHSLGRVNIQINDGTFSVTAKGVFTYTTAAFPTLAIAGAPSSMGPSLTSPTPSQASGASACPLNGQFAFLFTGFDANGPMAIAGSFTVDASGNVTDGVEDINRQSGALQNQAITGGACTTDPSGGPGVLVLSSSQGRLAFGFALRANGSEGRLIMSETAGTFGSGMIARQDPTAFLLSTFNGEFVLGLHGSDESGNQIVAAGRFRSDASGALSTGMLDFGAAGGSFTNLALGGSFGTPSPVNGRGTVTFSAVPAPGRTTGTFHFSFYVISATEGILLSTDGITVAPLLTGVFQGQP